MTGLEVAGLVLVYGADSGALDDVLPQELEAIERRGCSARRRADFILGRRCAQTALGRFGVRDWPVLPDADNVPQWPPGYVGSISHCEGMCVATVATSDQFRSVGIDVEPRAVVAENLEPWIFSDRERATDTLAFDSPSERAIATFSAKESFYKCIFPISRRVMDFSDVTVNFDPETSSFRVSDVARADDITALYARMIGRFEKADEHIFSLCILPAV